MFWLLFACQRTEVITGTAPDTERMNESSEPSEYIPPEDVTQEPEEWDLTGIEVALDEIFSTLRTRHTTPILSQYSMVMAQADSYCPQAYTVDGNSFWYGACTSTTGMSYDGYLFYNTYEEYDFFGDGGAWNVELLSGSTQMIDGEGRLIHWGGSAYLADGISVDGYPVFFSSVTGSFMDDGAVEPWLQEGQSHTLMMYGASFSEVLPINAFLVSGRMAWSGSGSGAVTAIEFGDTVTYASQIGYPCPAEPSGTLAVRDAHGRWVDIEFDVSSDWQLTGECDGCGVASFNGDVIGQVCVDISPLLDWGDSPWE